MWSEERERSVMKKIVEDAIKGYEVWIRIKQSILYQIIVFEVGLDFITRIQGLKTLVGWVIWVWEECAGDNSEIS